MARALWSGAISFGLVNIPVKLYRATASASARSISFHLLHAKCGTRIKNVRWCPKDDVQVPWKEIVRGYEVERGRYVVLDDAELDRLLPEEDYAGIAIESFVALSEVDPIFYDRAYYVAADGSARAYALLHQALAESGRVAIAHVTLRTRAHLAVVRTEDRHLVMSTMYFAAEVVDPGSVPGLDVVKPARADKRQLEAAQKLVDSLTTTWDPTRYHDEYTAQARALIEQKVEKGAVTESFAPATERGQVIDLLSALRQSVDAQKRGELPTVAPHPVHERRKQARSSRTRRHAAARSRRRHKRRVS
jgi:DNA end-binding protein Ku